MLIRVLASVLCASALFTTTTPTAIAISPNWDGCWGCNIVDGGQINSNLINVTLYTDGGTRLIVQSVDTYKRQVLVRDSRGNTYWMSAYNLYDASNKEERNIAAAGAAAGLITAFAALLGSSNSNSSSKRSSSNSRYQCERKCEQTIFHHDPRDDAAGQHQCKRRCR